VSRRALALLLGLAVVAATSCGGAPPRVTLVDAWPSTPPSYDDAHRRWTRRAGHSADFTRVIDAAATLASTEWRAAYARERARRLRLPPDEEARLVAAEQAAAAESWELELIVATARPEWNDLQKGQASMWRLALVGDDGREVAPLSVAEDRRPRAAIAEYFPDLRPFYRAYVVRFPKTTADGLPLAGQRLALKVTGTLAALEMVWAE
jgi:hypothetical protein